LGGGALKIAIDELSIREQRGNALKVGFSQF
jgi:hypothetical protein